MDEVLKIILGQGITGAFVVLGLYAFSKRDKQLIQNYIERLHDKDKIIDKLLDNETRTAQIIASFNEMKPVMDEIRELLKRIYTKSTGL